MCYPDIKANTVFFEIAHDPTGCSEAKGASACEQDGIHFINHLQGMQHVGFMGRWSASAHINTTNSPHIAEHDRTSCPRLQIGIVTNTHTRNISDVIVHSHISAFLILLPFVLLV